MKLFNKIWEFLILENCLLCRFPGQPGMPLCMACQNELPKNPYLIRFPFDDFIAPYHYQQPISEFITALKFNQQLKYAKIMGNLLADAVLPSTTILPELIIPVPLHKKRIKERGFNQAIEISRVIAKRLKIPLDYKSCIRIKNTEAQSSLDSKNRHENIKNAFSLNKKIPAKHIALVDDVITTGSTVIELIKSIKNTADIRIDVWCFAQA